MEKPKRPLHWSIKFVILKFSLTIDDCWMFCINYSAEQAPHFDIHISLTFASEIFEKVKLLQFIINAMNDYESESHTESLSIWAIFVNAKKQKKNLTSK